MLRENTPKCNSKMRESLKENKDRVEGTPNIKGVKRVIMNPLIKGAPNKERIL